MEISLSIVGTAGRKDDANKLNKAHFDAMCLIANGLVDELNENNYPITHLVSGGAAFADHVAVKLFLNKKVPNLRLFLPAEFECGSFKDNGSVDPVKNPGGTCNYYHKKFNNITRINSLTEIQLAKGEGAELIVVPGGFRARNALVAKSDCILAITFGFEREVKDGGTAHTVEMYLKRVRKERIFDKSFHYDLTTGKVYEKCIVPKEKPEPEQVKPIQARVMSNLVWNAARKGLIKTP